MTPKRSSSSVARRTAKSLIERAFATDLYARTLHAEAPTSLRCRPIDPAPGDPDFANALFQGRYAFSGEQRSALNEPPWSIHDTSEAGGPTSTLLSGSRTSARRKPRRLGSAPGSSYAPGSTEMASGTHCPGARMSWAGGSCHGRATPNSYATERSPRFTGAS